MWNLVVGLRNMLVGITTIAVLIMLHNGKANSGEVVVLTARLHASAPASISMPRGEEGDAQVPGAPAKARWVGREQHWLVRIKVG
jgi:hypothetical protein